MLTLAISEGGACEAIVARGGSIDDAYFGECGVCDGELSPHVMLDVTGVGLHMLGYAPG